MNRILAFAAVCGIALAGSSAQSVADKTEWSFGSSWGASGPMLIYSSAPGCGILPFLEQESNYRMSVYPAGFGPNGPDSIIEYQDGNDLILFRAVLTNKSLPTTFKLADIVETGKGQVDTYKTAVVFSKISPTLTEASTHALIAGKIKNFGNVADCTVNFRAALVR